MKFFLCLFIIFGFTTAFKSSEPKIFLLHERPADTLAQPEIQFIPSSISVDETTEKFIVREVKILNPGGAPLRIKSVTPSCGCASATVMNGTINPMTTGKIRLTMNTSGMNDTLNRVEFIVESNAKNSPMAYSVFVRLPQSALKPIPVE
ncbi:MAG TPA: DUF1573 domain-containing protein [Patescibacteria group bacterium]|nr:DUF1573 domain-containing protein [Patescibacteria group bacterium]